MVSGYFSVIDTTVYTETLMLGAQPLVINILLLTLMLKLQYIKFHSKYPLCSSIKVFNSISIDFDFNSSEVILMNFHLNLKDFNYLKGRNARMPCWTCECVGAFAHCTWILAVWWIGNFYSFCKTLTLVKHV